MQQEIKFWQGANFWVALTLAIGGLWAGFSESDAANAVGYVFALIGAIFAIREKVKGNKIDWKQWISSRNTWNYIATVVISIFPALTPELFVRLNELFAALIAGNWQGIVTALFSIATMLYYIVRKPKA